MHKIFSEGNIYLMGGISLGLLVFVETVQRGDLTSFLIWVGNHPLWATLNFILLAGGLLLIYLLSDRLLVALWLWVPCCMICAVTSFNKAQIREIPLMPWNMILWRELVLTIQESEKLMHTVLFYAVPSLLIISLTSLIWGRIKTGLSMRIRVFSIMAITVIVALCLTFVTLNTRLLGPVERYHELGFMGGFTSYALRPYMEKPQQDRGDFKATERLSYMQKEYGLRQEMVADSTPDCTPDIIMVQAESYWDPTLLKNIQFSRAPVPNLHKLQSSAISGRLLVNPYGGNTTNSEFEVLTGLCTSFLAPDTSAYRDFFRKEVPTLPLHLQGLGYKTEAIHPSDGSYLGRDKAFERMGFQRFITQEAFSDSQRKGRYISDASTAQKIIELYQEHVSQEPQSPYYSFTVTMQNHYDYINKGYENPFPLSTAPIEGLDLQELEMLQGYVEGVYDTDQMLGTLTEFFSQVERPVIVVFYGDHLPALGRNQHIYEIGGLVGKQNPSSPRSRDDLRSLHSVPFVIWDNYRGLSLDKGRLSAAYLQVLLLETYDLPMTPFQKFLAGAMAKNLDFGLAAWPDLQKTQEVEFEQRYRALIYETLFGD